MKPYRTSKKVDFKLNRFIKKGECYTGRNNKNYKEKDLRQQAYDRLKAMCAFGHSKHEEKQNGDIQNNIFSFQTFKNYMRYCAEFASYVSHKYPECKRIDEAKVYIKEWLDIKVEKDGSAWSIALYAASLHKLFQLSPGDNYYYQCPKRHREDITRSRLPSKKDKHFSEANNYELVCMAKGVGTRKRELTKLIKESLYSREQIKTELNRIKAEPLSVKSVNYINALETALKFNENYFVYIKNGKGGRKRFAPILNEFEDIIVNRFNKTNSNEQVFDHIPQADIHGYRSDYARNIYKKYAEDLSSLEKDKTIPGTNSKYSSKIYYCRKDEKGRKLSRRGMLYCSWALGHSRINVIASHYLGGM